MFAAGVKLGEHSAEFPLVIHEILVTSREYSLKPQVPDFYWGTIDMCEIRSLS
jgi:hypothetical protein